MSNHERLLRFLTLAQVASILRVSRRTVTNWAASGDLPVIWLGPRSPRVLETDLESFVERRRAGRRQR